MPFWGIYLLHAHYLYIYLGTGRLISFLFLSSSLFFLVARTIAIKYLNSGYGGDYSKETFVNTNKINKCE